MIEPFTKIEKPREGTFEWLRGIVFSFECVKKKRVKYLSKDYYTFCCIYYYFICRWASWLSSNVEKLWESSKRRKMFRTLKVLLFFSNA